MTSPQTDAAAPFEVEASGAPAPKVPETVFPKERWISVAGIGDWRRVKPSVMAGALHSVKKQNLTVSEVRDAIKRFTGEK